MSDWYLDFTNLTLDVDDRNLKVEEQLTEVTNHQMAQRHVLALVHDVESKEPFLLKFAMKPIQDRKDIDENFLDEIQAVDLIHELDHGPQYVNHINAPVGRGYPYSKGYVVFLLMTRVPGESVDDIFMDLPDYELEDIRRQLAYILENMRQNWMALSEQHSDFLRYDRSSKKLYLIDFTFMVPTDPSHGKPITVNDMFVHAFNI